MASFADGPELFSRPVAEHLRQVSKQSDQWSRRLCDNEIVTALSKGQFSDFKDGCGSAIFVEGPDSLWIQSTKYA